MKKWFILPILFCFFFTVSKVNASAIMETKQISNGTIDATFTFTESYVGEIQATMQIEGNVDLETIVWNSNISNYTKRYTYANNKLTIYIATGDTSKNLLDKNRVLKFGILKLKNTTKQKQNYSLKLSSVTIVDANYESNSIGASTAKNQYTILENDYKSPEEIPLPPTDDEDLPENRPDGSGNQNELNENDESFDDENKDDDSTSSKDVIEDWNDDEKSMVDSKNKEEEQKINETKKPDYFLIGLGVVTLFCFILLVIYIGKSNQY